MTFEELKSLEVGEKVTEPSGLGGVWSYKVFRVLSDTKVELEWNNSQYEVPSSWIPKYITLENAERFTKEVER